MGGCCSSDSDSRFPVEAVRDAKFKYSFESRTFPKRKLPEEKMQNEISGLSDTSYVRNPGTINNQQIQLDKCSNCDIYLCDSTDSVLLDDCVNCRIFIGPCSGSVFFRKCKDCHCIVACQQLRLRDCSRIEILLYVQGQPVIESSKGIKFGCFDYSYFELMSQMDECRLSAFNNWWSIVHDFSGGSAQNYTLMDPSIRCNDIMEPLAAEVEDTNAIVVPRTWGSRSLPSTGETAFIMFLPGTLEKCLSFLKEVERTKCELMLTDTKEALLSVADARRMFGESDMTEADVARVLAGPVIAIGYFGVNSTYLINTQASQLPPNVAVAAKSAQEAEKMARVILEVYRKRAAQEEDG